MVIVSCNRVEDRLVWSFNQEIESNYLRYEDFRKERSATTDLKIEKHEHFKYHLIFKDVSNCEHTAFKHLEEQMLVCDSLIKIFRTEDLNINKYGRV